MTRLISRRSAMISIGAALVLTPVSGVSRTLPALPETFEISTANGRMVQISLWKASKSKGSILFSHGALSAPVKYSALIQHWVQAGYDVWAPLHVDSTDHPDTKAFPGLKSWGARIEDMRALATHVGARQYIAAGHSYGALVALTMGGVSAQQPEGIEGSLRDPAVHAVIAFSPPGPANGLIDEAGYATLAVPALIQTGTRDVPPGMPEAGWKVHLAAYDAAVTGGDRFALVLDGVDHYFGNLICRPELPGPPQTAALVYAAETATLFAQALGSNDRRARKKLTKRIAKRGPFVLRQK